MAEGEPYYNGLVIEALACKFRELHVNEARRQSLDDSAENLSDYYSLPENIRQFYRVMAIHVLEHLEGSIKVMQFYAKPGNWIEITEDMASSKNVFDDMGELARQKLRELGFSEF